MRCKTHELFSKKAEWIIGKGLFINKQEIKAKNLISLNFVVNAMPFAYDTNPYITKQFSYL